MPASVGWGERVHVHTGRIEVTPRFSIGVRPRFSVLLGWCLTPILLFSCAAYVSNTSTTPTNELPNPYRTVAPWGKLPADHNKWGALNGVYVDNDGRSLWVVDRCGANPDVPAGQSPFAFDTCAGSSWAPVHKLDPDGNILKSFGARLFVFPHKIYQDRDGNLWVVDMRTYNKAELIKHPNAPPAGHTVTKLDQDGRVLLTIGTPGAAGHPAEGKLTEPCSIVQAPNGDLLITEGHSGQQPTATPDTVARISRFKSDGTFIRSFGKWGAGPVEFKTPHDIAIDAQGRLFVADRGNHRIQILDPEGNFLAEWKQFGRPSGVALRDGLIYVADSESNGVAPNPGWLRGIRVGELKTGKVLYRIPDPLEMKGTSAAEGVAVDAAGNVYGGEVGPRQVSKHVKQ
jgi:streptogramin lyase